MINLKLKYILFIGVFFWATSCSIEPVEIKYGVDHCAYCDMTVVDKAHAAEYVTDKGKPYIFDASECLLMQINAEQNEQELAHIMVADFANPGELTDARYATFLISENVRSPMGANLSAFSSKEKAEIVLQEHGGELFTWEEIKTKFSR